MVSNALSFLAIAALLSILLVFALGFVEGVDAAGEHCSSNSDNNNDNNNPARCSNQPHHHSTDVPFILPFP
jgi:hypothetical protein